MNAKPNDGGPAFPVHGIPVDPDTYLNRPGMALRDWFAGQIAAASITNATGLGGMSESLRKKQFVMLSELSYEIADAMLAAREKGAK